MHSRARPVRPQSLLDLEAGEVEGDNRKLAHLHKHLSLSLIAASRMNPPFLTEAENKPDSIYDLFPSILTLVLCGSYLAMLACAPSVKERCREPEIYG